MSKIYVFKFNSGEEIIGEYSQSVENENSGVVKNPVQLAMTSKTDIGFIPYLPYADTKNGIPINENILAFKLPLEENLANEYRKHFSKVMLPTPSKLIV